MQQGGRGGRAQSSLSVVAWRTSLQMERLLPAYRHLPQTSPRLESTCDHWDRPAAQHTERHGNAQTSGCIHTVLPTFSTKGNSHPQAGWPWSQHVPPLPVSHQPVFPPPLPPSSSSPVPAKCGNSKEPWQARAQSALAFTEKQEGRAQATRGLRYSKCIQPQKRWESPQR